MTVYPENGAAALARSRLSLSMLSVVAAVVLGFALPPSPSPTKPNIVYILADDLGYGELGVYGQKLIKTPHVDRLAAEGMRFTQAYSGSTVCAPSRSTFLTGKHTGHTYIRDNWEMGGWERGAPEGQLPLPANTVTLGRILQRVGYTTGAIGKWGLGGPTNTGNPMLQGFDHFYGYLCQRIAHNYYPTHLWRDGEKEMLNNPYFSAHQKLKGDPNDPSSYMNFSSNDYSQDLMAEAALEFIDKNKGRPFFLYLPFPVPHAALQVPDDSLEQYKDMPDKPYLGEKSYLPHMRPHAAYAGMISRMDGHVGLIMAKLKALGLDRNTLVVFTSDNGATFNGGSDEKFFQSNGGLRGVKTQLYEGGIRVPLIARWPGQIRPGQVSELPCAMWDMLPTFTALAGAPTPKDIDGVSLVPTLLGVGTQVKPASLYWEYHSGGGWQAVRMGDWKAVRRNAHKDPNGPIELYNLRQDPAESRNVAAQYPDVVDWIAGTMRHEHSRSPIARWNF